MAIKKNENSILILEDEEHYGRVLQLKLKIEGYQVKVVKEPEDFIKEFKKGTTDLALVDLILRNKTGFEVLENINKLPQFKKTKVLIYSSLGQEDDKKKALKLGASDYLVKSEITLQDLVATVKKYLK
ncbi:MAG: response regulator [Patescibacteria group bacterium]